MRGIAMNTGSHLCTFQGLLMRIPIRKRRSRRRFRQSCVAVTVMIVSYGHFGIDAGSTALVVADCDF
jgi:hypothetical protein